MEFPILFVGQAERPEFCRVVDYLRTRCQLITVRNPLEAAAALSRDPPPHRILIAPAHRDEFREGELHRLVQLQPLAEMFLLVGPWLEGETRSGRPWLAAQRLYLDQVIPWWRSSQARADSLNPSHCQWQPPTWSSDEACQLAAAAPWPSLTGCVVLCSELVESRRSLAVVCQAAGLDLVAHAPDQRVECAHVGAVIYDAVLDRSRWQAQIRQLADSYRPESLIVLLNFPRPDEWEAMLRAGATGVLGKPFQLEHLLTSLRRLPAITARAVA